MARMRLHYRISRRICQLAFWTIFRGRAYGAENVPLDGGVLLLSNHQSFLDPMLATLALPRECNYMARHTLGRRILEQGRLDRERRKGPAPQMRILGKEYPLRAGVAELDGFSAHADRGELMRFVSGSNLNIDRIAVVHGEEDQALSLSGELRSQGYDAFVPRPADKILIE